MTQILQSSVLDQFSAIKHGFATRELSDNYEKLSDLLKINRNKIFYLKQIHSDKVVCVEAQTNLKDLPEADALITDCKNTIIGVRTADCLPLLVYDPVQNVVAAIHAGYRGVLNKVIQNTFSIMQNKYGCDPKNFLIALGPSICIQHYEVGDEVIREFKKVYGENFVCKKFPSGKFHLDVKAIVRLILQDSAVPEAQISNINFCTFEHENLLYSHRRDQENGRRQFNFIALKS